MKYYKKVSCGFVDWVLESEETIDGAIEISKDEYDSLVADDIEDETLYVIDEN